jgi:hypothetical protein
VVAVSLCDNLLLPKLGGAWFIDGHFEDEKLVFNGEDMQYQNTEAHGLVETKNVMKEHFNQHRLTSICIDAVLPYLPKDILRVIIGYAEYAMQCLVPLRIYDRFLILDPHSSPTHEVKAFVPSMRGRHHAIGDMLKKRRYLFAKYAVTEDEMNIDNLFPSCSLLTPFGEKIRPVE